MTRRKATIESILKRSRVRKRTVRRMMQRIIQKQVASSKKK